MRITTHDGAVGVAPQACSTAAPQRREQAAGPAPHQRHDVVSIKLEGGDSSKNTPNMTAVYCTRLRPTELAVTFECIATRPPLQPAIHCTTFELRSWWVNIDE